MSAANAWTVDIETKGLPQLKELYKLYGKQDLVVANTWKEFGHNYNQVAREMMYNFLAKHLPLGASGKVEEQPFVPVSPKELSVFDAKHPRPKDEMNADGTPKFSTKRFTGPLYTDGLAATDVKQGQIGNCYMPAGVASVAHVMPEVIKEMIKDNGNGSYTVTFKEEDYRNGGYKNKEITVDADLYVRSYGGPLYGSSSGSTSPDKMEMWWPVLEKAFAQWKGSFNAIGNGGVASEVIEAIVGRPNADLSIRYSDETKVWNKIKTSVDNKMPVAAGTYGKDEASRYTNTGVHSNHAYSILGYEERGGEKYVNIRNPWGETEPWPGDGKNDGIFALKLKDFMKLYQTVYTCLLYTSDAADE